MMLDPDGTEDADTCLCAPLQDTAAATMSMWQPDGPPAGDLTKLRRKNRDLT